MAAILRVKDENGNIVSIPAIKGDKGEKGDRGLPGSGGVPDGGTTGQVLTKNSNADGDAGWKDTAHDLFNANGKTYEEVIYAYESGKVCYLTYAGTKLLNNGYSGNRNPFKFSGENSNGEILTATLSYDNTLTFGDRGDYQITTASQTLSKEKQSQALANIGGLSKNQGTANSGKFLGIGADGIVVPTEVGGGGSQYAVLYTEQELTEEQQMQARANIGAGTSDFSGSYNDLKGSPEIPKSLSELSEDSDHRTVSDAEKESWNQKSNFSGDYGDLNNKPIIPEPYVLPAATAETLGGVKIGDGISIAEDGTISSEGSGGSSEWRKIKDVSVTSEAGVTWISITEDQDGNSFSLDEVFILIKSETKQYAYAQITIPNGSQSAIVGEYRLTGETESSPGIIRIRPFGPFWIATFMKGGYQENIVDKNWGFYYTKSQALLSAIPKIAGIGLGFSTLNAEVWGR